MRICMAYNDMQILCFTAFRYQSGCLASRFRLSSLSNMSEDASMPGGSDSDVDNQQLATISVATLTSNSPGPEAPEDQDPAENAVEAENSDDPEDVVVKFFPTIIRLSDLTGTPAPQEFYSPILNVIEDHARRTSQSPQGVLRTILSFAMSRWPMERFYVDQLSGWGDPYSIDLPREHPLVNQLAGWASGKGGNKGKGEGKGIGKGMYPDVPVSSGFMEGNSTKGSDKGEGKGNSSMSVDTSSKGSSKGSDKGEGKGTQAGSLEGWYELKAAARAALIARQAALRDSNKIHDHDPEYDQGGFGKNTTRR